MKATKLVKMLGLFGILSFVILGGVSCNNGNSDSPDESGTQEETGNKIVLTKDNEVVSSTTATYENGTVKLDLEAADSGHGIRWNLGTNGVDLSKYKIVINYTAKDAYEICVALESTGSGTWWEYKAEEVYTDNPIYTKTEKGDDKKLELTADTGTAKVLFLKYNTYTNKRTDNADITINSIELVEKENS